MVVASVLVICAGIIYAWLDASASEIDLEPYDYTEEDR